MYPAQLFTAVWLMVAATCCAYSMPSPAARRALSRSQALSTAGRFLEQTKATISNDDATLFPQPEVAVGSPFTDQQQMVLDTTQSPFTAVGQIIMSTQGSRGMCTGSLIAPSVVLTAAHCWYENGEAHDSAYFTPAYSAAVTPHRPYGSAEVVSVKLPTAFLRCYGGAYQDCDGLYDYALFFLNTSYPMIDTISYGYSTDLPDTQTVYTAGYPGDKCNSDQAYSEQCPMWFTACAAQHYDEVDAFETVDCFSGRGQSGSPVWISVNESTALQVAILTSTPANDQRVAYSGETPTLNVVITPARYQQLQGWMTSGATTKDKDVTQFTTLTSS